MPSGIQERKCAFYARNTFLWEATHKDTSTTAPGTSTTASGTVQKTECIICQKNVVYFGPEFNKLLPYKTEFNNGQDTY